MNKIQITLLLFTYIITLKTNLSGQDIHIEDKDLANKFLYSTNKMQFVSQNEIFYLSLFNEEAISIYKNSSDFSNPAYYKTQKEKSNYKNYLGNFGDSKTRTFVFAKNSKKKFLLISYSLQKEEKIREEVLDFKMNETYFGHFTHNKLFFVFGKEINSSNLILYSFGEDFKINKHKINLEEGEYFLNGVNQGKMSYQTSMYINQMFTLKVGSNRKFRWIRDDIPNSNEDVTQSNKMYLFGKDLVLTLDGRKEQTTLIKINLESFESKTHIVDISFDFDVKTLNHKSNSFLVNNLLFQINGDKKKVGLSVFDLLKSERKEILVFDKETPYLKNQNTMITESLLKKHRLTSSLRKKENTVQERLNRIMKSGNKVGFQITQDKEVYLITLGGYLERSGGAPGMIGPPGMVGVGGFSFGFGFYGSFVRDESLNFYISKEDLGLTFSEFENPYARMGTFLQKEYGEFLEKSINREVKFKIGTDYFLGYMDRKSRTYFFRKFN